MISELTDRAYEALPGTQTPAPFLITPLTARVGSREVFRVEIMPGYRPLDRWGVTAVTAISHDGTDVDGKPLLWDDYQQLEFSFEGKTMLFTAFFHQEGKYTVQLRCGERVAMEVAVYALEEDLYGCVALKGDFHSHSYASDGKHAPGLAAMRGRKRGLDFMSVTDHGVYQGSLDAIAALKDTGSSLLLCPGEEMHLPLRPDLVRPYNDTWFKMPWVEGCLAAHLVNFGGSFSVNEYARKNPGKYFSEVAELEAEMPGELSDFDRFSAAAAEWAFDKVREGGGLAIYPHPYWALLARNAVSDSFNKTVFSRNKFDAFEAANYNFQEANYIAMAEYARQREAGNDPAVVGCSDLHNADAPEMWSYTVLLAEEFSQQGICAAVRKRRSCAVLPLPGAALPVVTGEFRIVRYVLFLLQHYFPEHDKWCALEGELLERAQLLPQGSDLEKAVGVAAGAVEEYRKKSFPGCRV